MTKRLFRMIVGFLAAMWPLALAAQVQREVGNFSIRTRVDGTAAGVSMLTLNFMVEGATKTVLLRVVGPTLGIFGVQGVLADPVLRVYDGTGALVATNTGWSSTLAPSFAGVGAFPLPNGSNDAALELTLAPGTYTAAVGSVSGSSGIVLLEVYDPQATGRLAYFAARNHAGTGADGLIGSFTVPGTTPVAVLVRGLGPALAAAAPGTLANPLLTLQSGGTGALLASNDDWDGASALSEAAAAAGLMPLAAGSRDAAVLASAAQGGTVVQVTGAGGGTGLGSIEVAQIDATRPGSFAPAILTPPREMALSPGASVMLGALAIGKPAPSYQWRKNGVAIAGAVTPSFTIAAAQASDAGTYTVALTNTAGTTIATVATVGLTNSVTITTQPSAQSVAAGSTATFSVAAVGSPAPSYQWLFNGAPIAGATQSTLTLTNVTVANAGLYSVRVSNGASTVTSTAAALEVRTGVLTIVTHPVSQTVTSGGSATFSVVAAGTPPLTYQWLRDGAILGGATQASYTIPLVLGSAAASYSVRVTDINRSVVSNAATLTVRPSSVVGGYFGTLGNGDGPFAVLIRADGTGVFLGYWRFTRQALIAQDVRVDAERKFRFTAVATGGSGAPGYLVEGRISDDGQLLGSIVGLTPNMVAGAPQSAGRAEHVGFYQGGAAGGTARTYAIVGGAGDIVSVTVEGSVAEAGRGTVAQGGDIFIVNETGGRTTGTVQGDVATLATTPFGGGAARMYQAANLDTRTDVEKLVNISTRSQTGAGTEALIAGFVVSGEFSKSVLVRAIGPSLAQFGVGNPLSAARLEVYSGQTLVAQSTDWGTVANADDVAAAAVRVSAFPLARNSQDAALLLTLQPGPYTAIVSGQAEATGVSLVEVYDASVGTVPPGERIINIATRGVVGAGDQTLIAGFVITGRVPKRVLVRGVGPTLASSFGVSGVLARPRVAVLAGGGAEVVENARWSNRPDAAEIAAAAQAAGAFPLAAGSEDAALIVNLPPGAYSAQVTDAGGGTASGVALVEVYELR